MDFWTVIVIVGVVAGSLAGGGLLNAILQWTDRRRREKLDERKEPTFDPPAMKPYEVRIHRMDMDEPLDPKIFDFIHGARWDTGDEP